MQKHHLDASQQEDFLFKSELRKYKRICGFKANCSKASAFFCPHFLIHYDSEEQTNEKNGRYTS